MGAAVSGVSCFISDPRNFAEVTRLSENIKKPWLKTTRKEIKNVFNNQTFLLQDPEKDETMTPCMDVYNSKTQSGGSLHKLGLRTVVRGDLKNKDLVGNTW